MQAKVYQFENFIERVFFVPINSEGRGAAFFVLFTFFVSIFNASNVSSSTCSSVLFSMHWSKRSAYSSPCALTSDSCKFFSVDARYRIKLTGFPGTPISGGDSGFKEFMIIVAFLRAALVKCIFLDIEITPLRVRTYRSQGHQNLLPQNHHLSHRQNPLRLHHHQNLLRQNHHQNLLQDPDSWFQCQPRHLS